MAVQGIHIFKPIQDLFIHILFLYRPCGSYDALISPQQPQLPNPEWYQQLNNSNNCNPNKLYTCSSDCSDQSLKNHSQHSHHSSQGAGSGGSTSGCKKRSSSKCLESHCNGNNIYENDEERCTTVASDPQQRITNGTCGGNDVSSDADRQSECCSSSRDCGDGDTCCSCSESSCLYAEAEDPPTQQAQIIKMQQN